MKCLVGYDNVNPEFHPVMINDYILNEATGLPLLGLKLTAIIGWNSYI